MLVTTSWFMAETRTNTTQHSTKRSEDFTSLAAPSMRRNAGSTSQASSSSGTYSSLMVPPPPLRKLKRCKTRLNFESRYSQTEREALAVVWACEHFDIYVSCASFTVVTDHKPLVHIWSKPHPALRIARWSLRLQPYDLTIVFRSGKDNPADYMSRYPATKEVRSSREEKIAEEYVEFISQTFVPNGITLEQVQGATAKGKVLQTDIELCNTGRWH